MSNAWSGNISLDGHEVVEGESDVAFSAITLHSASDESSQHIIPPQTSLRFLSIVQLSSIPLHLIVGSAFTVTTTSTETERWFSRFLLASLPAHGGETPLPWWRTARPESPLGVLVSVGCSSAVAGPRVTEVLFYASYVGRHNRGRSQAPPSLPPEHDTSDSPTREDKAELQLHAIALSSDQLCDRTEATPPTSPSSGEADIEPVFLPLRPLPNSDSIHEPPTKKRKTLTDAFDQATERRKTARRRDGEGVVAAAAFTPEDALPSLKHRRSTSGSTAQPIPLQTRSESAAPGISASRPVTARPALAEASRRSTLSRVESVSTVAVDDTVERGNRDLISRGVMAGMRLYGLAQSKTRRARDVSSAMPSPALDAAFEMRGREQEKVEVEGALEGERRRDEEYKLIYHQAFKGACFAFRQHIGRTNLQPRVEALRETVDKLLAVFCGDPLEIGLLPTMRDELTPGGRKAFGAGGREGVGVGGAFA